MTPPNRFRTSLLAAVSLTAATLASGHAAAAPAMAPSASIEQALENAGHEADRTGASVVPHKAGLATLVIAAAAGLARLIGWPRIRAAAATTARVAGEAARAGMSMTTTAVKAAATALASPMRAAAVFLGAAFIALAVVGLYDVEWAGGFIFGALLSAALFLGARKARLAFGRAAARVRH